LRPLSRLPGPVMALAADGDDLWVATADIGEAYSVCVFLFDLQRYRWSDGVRVKATNPSFAVGGGKLWLCTQSPLVEVRSLDKQSFLTKSREQWMSAEIAPAEVTAALKNLSAHQAALCHLLWGEPSRAAELLAAEKLDLGSETLFLLAMANDGDGLNQPAQSNRYIGQLLTDYSDGVFAKYFLNRQKQT